MMALYQSFTAIVTMAKGSLGHLNKMVAKPVGLAVALCLLLLSAASCALIDEDQSDCGDDYRIDYELRLVTNMSTQLTTELSMSTEVVVATELRSYLSNVFTDRAHDINLSFYDVDSAKHRLYHWSDTIDANQTSYELHLPMRRYMHLCAANLEDNPTVFINGDDYAMNSRLEQQMLNTRAAAVDTIRPHTTGIFTARQAMDVQEGIDQTFDVHLYMANCATALVVDTAGSGIADMQVLTTGFASEFNLLDSTYQFKDSVVVLNDKLPIADDVKMCFASVNFPSRDNRDPGTKTIIEVTEPFESEDGVDGYWRMIVHVTLADHTVTETILTMNKPLRAGQLEIIKAYIRADGATIPTNTKLNEVGSTVTLDWKDNGGSHDIDI